MQFDDPRSILEGAAAKPSRDVDPVALVQRGRRLRRARYAAAAAGLAVSIVGATVSFGMLGGDGGPSPAAGCDDPRWWILVRRGCIGDGICEASIPYESAVYLRNGTARAEALELRDDLLDRPGVEHVEYVSPWAAYEEFRRLYPTRRDLHQTISPRDLPSSLRVKVADEATSESLLGLVSPIVDEVRTGGDLVARICGDVVRPAKPSPEDDAELGEPSPPPETQPSPPSGLKGILSDARCSLERPEELSIEGPDFGKWCTFQVEITNRGPNTVDLDGARLRLGSLSVDVTYSSAYFEDPSTPKLVDVRVEPGKKVFEKLFFLVGEGEEPADLVIWSLPPGPRLKFELDYDCSDLRSAPDRTCVFGLR